MLLFALPREGKAGFTPGSIAVGKEVVSLKKETKYDCIIRFTPIAMFCNSLRAALALRARREATVREAQGWRLSELRPAHRRLSGK
jgi:hypothetical protein